MERGTAPPSMVGRFDELRRLEQSVEAAAAGLGSTVLVAGEAGIGKTRLVAELAAHARAAGATVLSGRCIDLVGSGLPYLPLVEALRGPGRTPPLAELGGSLRELARLVPELADPDAPLPADPGGADSQLRLFEETLTVLERLGAETPVVLVLEDLHWADGSTLDLVAFLAHAVPGRRILLVATYRSDEPGDALRRLVAELVRARGADLLELAPLGPAEIARLLSERAEEPLPATLAAAIGARSEGNPFFAEELFAAAGRGEETLPPLLRDVLLQRVDLLGEEPRAMLRVAAAAGRDVPYRLLAAVTSRAEPRLVDALRDAVEHEVLVADQAAGSFRFRHALLAEAVYATVLPGEREELHARLAAALAEDPALATSSVAAELAHHWAAAGRPREALDASVDAARDAEAVAGLTEALRHLELTLELWPRVDDAEALVGLGRAAVLEWAAEVAYFGGAGMRAVELIRQAIDAAGPDADAVRLGLLHEQLGTCLLPVGEREAALAAYERAAALVPERPPSPERVRVLGALAQALSVSWRHAESRAVSEEAIAVAEAIGDDRPALRARAYLGVPLLFAGRGAEGVECLLETRRRAGERGTPPDVMRTYVMLSDLLLIAGRLQEAAADALEGLAAARRSGYERSSGIVMAANAAEALLGTGDWAQAEQVLDDALRAGGGFRPEAVHVVSAQLALGRGELEAASRHLEAGSQAALEPQSIVAYACLQAELALSEGRPADAARLLDDALRADAASDLEIRGARACALGLRAETERARLAAVRRDTRAVDEARLRGRRLLDQARRSARAAAAVAPDASGWLATAEAEHSALESRSSPALWEAAVAAWDELGRPYLAADCGWRLAEALVASGALRTEAAVPARAAARVAESLGAEPLRHELELLALRARLDLADSEREGAEPAGDHGLGLTAREGEVLRLLARGYTNREIADALTISVKTASTHVSNILRKLGVSTRLEAAAIAQRLTPK